MQLLCSYYNIVQWKHHAYASTYLSNERSISERWALVDLGIARDCFSQCILRFCEGGDGRGDSERWGEH